MTTNRGDIETTVHWHGLRLANEADGVPGDTQDPIEIGESYTCRVKFPDAGIYWYHPHLREDYAQEMGLYGTIIVRPRDESYWAPADRELTITLDDVMIEDGKMVPFGRSGPNFTAMGRFGNTMLINGQTEFAEEVDRRRGRPPPPGQHGQYAHLQHRRQWRADEAGRRRQRPRRAGGVRRGGAALTV